MRFDRWFSEESELPEKEWKCGFCLEEVEGSEGFMNSETNETIYRCPNCRKPTHFDTKGKQITVQRSDKHYVDLPIELKLLYENICISGSAGAFIASALSSVKTLRYLAAEKGAAADSTFESAVDYLVAQKITPSKALPWVTHVKDIGKAVDHEILTIGRKDAVTLVVFIDLILETEYSFPGANVSA